MADRKRNIVLAIGTLALAAATTLFPQAGRRSAGFEVTGANLLVTKVKVSFSEAVDPSSLTPASLFLLTEEGLLPYSLEVHENGRRVFMRIGRDRFPALFRPLILVLGRGVRSLSGKSLDKGFAKAFNVLEIEPVSAPPTHFGPRAIVVSQNPRVEILAWKWHAFWARKFLGGRDHDADEKDDLPFLEKSKKDECDRFSDSTGIKVDEWLRNVANPGFLRRFHWPQLHPPQLTVSGVQNGEVLDHDAVITYTASDPDNNLSFLGAILDFVPFPSGGTVSENGSHFIFALAVDTSHLFDSRFITFRVEKSQPRFISLVPGQDVTVSSPSLAISGEVENAVKVLVNGSEAPLAAGKFATTVTLQPGQNPILVVATGASGQTVERSFTATYQAVEPPTLVITSPLPGAYIAAATVAVSGTVQSTSPVLSVTVNGVAATLVPPDGFTAAAVPLPAEGACIIRAEAVNQAGLTGSAETSVVRDTVAPELAIGSPANGSFLNAPKVTVTGTVSDANLLSVTLGGLTAQVSGNAFTLTDVPLAEGDNSLLVGALDRAGNRTEAPLLLHVDSVGPVVTVTSPAEGAWLNAPTVAISGTVAEANLLSVTIGGTAAQLSGSAFTFDSYPLAEGDNNLLIVALDRAGNRSEKPLLLHLDTAAPVLAIDSPAEGSWQKALSVAVSGTVTEANLLSVTLGGLTAQVSGNAFTLTDVPLAEGDNSLLVVALDRAGNRTEAPLLLHVDSAGPVVTVTSPEEGSLLAAVKVTVTGTAADANLASVKIGEVTAQLSGNGFTFSDLPLAEGENRLLIAAEDLAGNRTEHTLTLWRDTGGPAITVTSPAEGSVLSTPTVAVTGTASDANLLAVKIGEASAELSGTAFTFPAVVLTEGDNSLLIVATDKAGNRSEKALLITLDTVAPAVTLEYPTAGLIVNTPAITVKGRIDELHASAVRLSGVDGQIVGSSFFFDSVALQPGENTLQVEAEDKAGNRATSQVTVTLDTAPPVVSITEPAGGALLPSGTVLVRGTAADSGSCQVTVNGQAATLASGAFSLELHLPEGDSLIQALASDGAGNSASTSVPVTVDSRAPVLTLLTPASGAILSLPTVEVRGTVDEPHLRVLKINGQDAVVASGSFTLPALALAEGDNAIIAAAEDTLGRHAEASLLVRRDSSAPRLLSILPADQATGVPVGVAVEANFSEEVTASSVNSSTFYLTLPSGDAVAGSISVSGRRATFSPTASYPDSTRLLVHLTTAIRDAGGNALANPGESAFTTTDRTAPPAPLLDPVPERTSLPGLTLSGSAEPGSTVSCSGGRDTVSGKAGADGHFSLSLLLNPGQLNQLLATATDPAGNASSPAQASVIHDASPFAVADAAYTPNLLQLLFSRAPKPETVTDSSFRLVLPSGPVAGTLSQSGSTVTFTPGLDLSSLAFTVEVSTSVADGEGIPLAAPYSQMFNAGGGQVAAEGEVYDGSTGLPLEGVKVTLIDCGGQPLPDPAPFAVTGPSGQYVLTIPASRCTLRLQKPGYTQVDRTAAAISGFGALLFDALLFPQPASTLSLPPAGGTVTSAKGEISLILPEGAVAVETAVSVTLVDGQTLAGRLPGGWSPLAAVDVAPAALPLAKSATLRLPEAALQPFLTPPLPADLRLVLARYDRGDFRWKAVAYAYGSEGYVNAPVDSTGQYALVVKDLPPTAPADAVIGEPLPELQVGGVPAVLLSASLQFQPAEVFPGEHSTGTLALAASEPIPSGVPVQARVTERHELISGKSLPFPPYTVDLVSYTYASNSSRVDFSLSPSREIVVSELKLGTLEAAMLRYLQQALGVIVGPDGGTVTGLGGAEVKIDAGSVSGPVPVTVAAKSESSLTVALPSGFRFLGAVEFACGGSRLSTAATLSLPADPGSIPAGTQVVLARAKKVGADYLCLFSQTARIEAGRMASDSSSQAFLPLPGVVEGGLYLFLQPDSSAGYFRGGVSDGGQPLPNALVTASSDGLASLSQASGLYAACGLLGSNLLTARNLASGDLGSASGTLSSANEVLLLDLSLLPTPPTVLAVNPADGATDVPVGSTVQIIFSEAVKPSTVTAATVALSCASKPVEGSRLLSEDGRTLLFTPVKALPSGAIDLVISTAVTDLAGYPLAAPFSSRFTTRDFVPPPADPKKIRVLMPDGTGKVRVLGEAWSTEAGATVLVFNDRTGVTKSVTTGSDGSFTLELDARTDDLLFITVMDAAGNKTVVETPPFTSADGKTVVLDSRSREYVTPEGFGVRLEPGTFAHAVPVRLARVTDPGSLTPLPAGYSRLQAVNLDFSGEQPLKSLKLSMPAPAGLPPAAQLLVARQVSVSGQQRLMVMDTCALVGDRVETNSPPFPGVDADGLYAFIYNASYMLSYVSLPSLSASCALVSDGFVFISDSWSTTCTLPFRIDETAGLKVYDTVTGEKLWEGEKKAPGTAGQTYAYTDVKNESDKALPYPVSVSGFTLYAFNLSSVEASAGLITATATDANDDHVPEEGTVTVTGKEKALPELREGLPPWSVRLYNFRLPAAPGAQGTLSAADPVDSDMKGAFSTAITASLGDRLLLVPEKGEVPLSTSWTFTFSEPLDAASVSKDTIKLVKIVEGNRLTVEAEVKMAETDSGSTLDNKFLLKPKAVLDAGRRYEIVLEGIRDRAGNSTTSLILPFRTIQPQNLGYDATPEVYGSLRLGAFLYVAAGSAGLRVLDVSNPARPTLKGELRAATLGRVRGVARFGSTGSRLAIVGGGDQVYGYVKIVDVSNPAAPSEVSSLAISIPIGQTPPPSMQRYVFGQPRDVEVVGNTAFVSVFGGGLVTVDLSRMSTDEYDNRCIVGLFPEEFIVGVKPLRTTDGSGNVTVQHLAIAVDYLGIKIIDATSTFYPRFADTPEERQVKAGRVTVGLWELPWREHLSGLEVAMDVPYDVNNDGKVAEGEVKDLLFVAAATRATLFTLDVDNPISPAYFGEVALRDREGNESLLVGEILYCRELGALFLTDRNLGLVRISTRNLAGARLDADGDKVDDRILAIVATRGAADFGLAIDPYLNVAYVGEEGTGVEGIKIGQPLIRIVEAKEETPGGSDTLKSVEGLYPAGFEASHNVYGHPSTFRVAASLPGVLGDTVEAEVTSLGSQFYPLVRWTPTTDTAKNTVVKVTLRRQGTESDRNNDHYNLFISDPVLALAKPEAEDGDNPHNAAAFLFSGDWVRATLSRDGIAKVQAVAGMSDYLDTGDLSLAADLKRSLPIELAMPEKPAPRQNPSIGSGEVSHSGPGLGGSSFSSVFLHSGELFLAETDLAIPGRGLDTAFTRRYQSQAVYSGPLGFGWDHGLNRRLVELPDGTVFYYDGSGRRDEFKPKRTASGEISDFDSPAGLFAELKKRIDGTYILRYADGTFERYDPFGRLQGIQDRFENKVECDYNLAGQLGSVVDSMGRVTVLDYYPMEETLDGSRVSMKTGRIKEIIDPIGRRIEYDYESNTGDLILAKFEGKKKEYSYFGSFTNIRDAHNLDSVTDPKNQKYLEVTYEGDDRVNWERICGKQVTVGAGDSAAVTDSRGNVFNYTHDSSGHLLRSELGNQITDYAVNTDGLFTSLNRILGNKVEFTYDSGSSDPRRRGNLLSVTQVPDGGRGGALLTSTFIYDSTYNQLLQSTDPAGIVTHYTLGNEGKSYASISMAGISTTSYDHDKYGRVVKETDPLGKVTAYEYYPESAPTGDGTKTAAGRPLDTGAGGFLKKVTLDSGGDNIYKEYVYNSSGALKEERDGEGASVRYTRNVYNEPETIVRGAGLAVSLESYTYDANGNMNYKSAAGISEWWTHNKANLPLTLTRQASGASQDFAYTYDLGLNLQSVNYPRGNVDEFEYDHLNRVVKKKLGNATTTLEYRYDANGNLVETIDGAGKSWKTTYDGNDRVIGSQNPLGKSVNLQLDNAGNVTRVNAPLGMNSAMEYNHLSQLKSRTTAGTIREDYAHDNAGNMVGYTTPNRKNWDFTPTGSGMLGSSKDPAGNQDDYAYNKQGLATRVTEKEAGGRQLEHNFTRDAQGKVTNSTDSAGRSYTGVYNGTTQDLEGVVDPEGGTRSYVYDGLGRLTRETIHVGNGQDVVRTHEYDQNGNQVGVKDGKGNETRYTYDFKDRLTDVLYPDGKSEHYQYDGNDRVTSSTDGNGTRVLNVYDDAGRLTLRTIQAGPGVAGTTQESFVYDDLDRIVKAENDFGSVSFIYTPDGRLEKETQQVNSHSLPPAVFQLSYNWDSNGNKTRIDYPSGRSLSIIPDDLDRVKSMVTTATDFFASYTYEGRSKVTQKNLNNKVTVSVNHDDGQRPLTMEYTGDAGKILIGRDVTWNRKDLKTSETWKDEGNKVRTFFNDPADRLLKDEKQNQERWNSFDSADNVLKRTERLNGKTTELLGDYNNRNQRIKFGLARMAYDGNGNLATYRSREWLPADWTYSYDYANRLTKAVKANGDVVEFVYDALGRRARKVFTDHQTHQQTTKTYVWDGDQVVEERTDASSLVVGSSYIYGNGIDEPLCIEKLDEVSGQMAKYLPMQDTNGSVLGLANNQGRLVEKVQYNDFGTVKFEYDHVKPRVDVARLASGSILIRFSESITLPTGKDPIKLYHNGSQAAANVTLQEEDRVALLNPSAALVNGQ